MARPITILCLASFWKGAPFLRAAKALGARVVLLTSKTLEGADWPSEAIDDIYYIQDVENQWDMTDVVKGVSWLARNTPIDRIVALDDFDVEKAAALREHLRVPGMGDTTARYFRDKLAMRTRARETGIVVPEFTPLINHQDIRDFLARVPAPYVLKPRSMAAAIGIRKIPDTKTVWAAMEELGDLQSFYLLEQFVPGRVFHVDSVVADNRVRFAVASEYGTPPLETAHEGRVSTTRTLRRRSPEERALLAFNQRLLKSLGLRRGVSHSEFIQDTDGTLFFLETSARVGGAHIVDLVAAATGVNLWTEWARIVYAPESEPYLLVPPRKQYAGMLLSLAKQETPDLSAYSAPEIVWRLTKRHHAGLIVASPKFERVEELLAQYSDGFYRDFFASEPPRTKATE